MGRRIMGAAAAAAALLVVGGCGGANESGAPAQETQGAVTVTAVDDGSAPSAATLMVVGHETVLAAATASTGPTLTVRARGTMAAGVGPTMQVLVGGAAVGSVEVKAADYSDYVFPLGKA